AAAVWALAGTCLQVGCMPSKALLASSEQYEAARGALAAHGIKVADVTLDLAAMLKRKDKIVSDLTGGVATLFKANKIDYYHGHGTLHAGRKVTVAPANGGGKKEISAEHVILASGSEPMPLPSVPFDHEVVVDSTGALSFGVVPGKLGVIGAGVIGLELGSVWRRLGSEVVILEALDSLLPTADAHIARDAAKQFKKQGLDIRLGAKVTGAKVDGGKWTVAYESGRESHELTVD